MLNRSVQPSDVATEIRIYLILFVIGVQNIDAVSFKKKQGNHSIGNSGNLKTARFIKISQISIAVYQMYTGKSINKK